MYYFSLILGAFGIRPNFKSSLENMVTNIGISLQKFFTLLCLKFSSQYRSIHLSIYPYIYLYFYTSLSLFIYPLMHLSIYPYTNLFMYLYIYKFIHLCIHPSIHLHIGPSTHAHTHTKKNCFSSCKEFYIDLWSLQLPNRWPFWPYFDGKFCLFFQMLAQFSSSCSAIRT